VKKQTSKKEYWGFDRKDMDLSVRPQDDFYRYSNGGWLKKEKIPPTEARWGSFYILRYETEKQLRILMKELLRSKKQVHGSPAQLVADYYRSAVDLKRRNTLGTKPLQPYLQEIRALKDKKGLVSYLSRAHAWGGPGPFGLFVDQDEKQSSRYILRLWQGGLGMPDRDYYVLNGPEQKRVRDAYLLHIDTLLRAWGVQKRERSQMRDTVMRMETRLAEASMKKEETRDSEKTYHKYSVSKLNSHVPQIDWNAYLQAVGVVPSDVIVSQPDFFAEVGRMLQDISLEDWKCYLEWELINGSSSLLSTKFVKISFNFYSRTLAGVQKMRPLWRRGLGATNGAVGEALGKMYIDRYFPPHSKKAMDALVTDLFAVYAERMKTLQWMSSATKRKGLIKLRAMKRKIGYPRKWESFKGLRITPKDYFGNAVRTHQYEFNKRIKRLRGPVDREEWFMNPQTVNAYFHPTLNEIVFPAAILQWPFFDPKADAAVNYGAIGSVIGHEITHGFDDQGSKYDARGNLKSWWSNTYRKKFTQRADLLVKQYNTYNVAPGVNVNGQLTLGENIADLGGLTIGYEAYQRHLTKTKTHRDIDGFSPEERFFLGFSQAERMLTRPESEKTAVLTDPHSPSSFRVNGPAANFDPFYEVYKVKKGDKLYKDSKKRARIW
jgi:predicted metalloendopeptidase